MDGLPLILLFTELPDIHLHDIVVDELYIRQVRQGLLQDGNQVVVDLHGDNLFCVFRKLSRHGADARPDFQDAVLRAHAGGFHDAVQDPRVDEEVLSELLPEDKIMLLYDFYRILRYCKILCHIQSFCISLLCSFLPRDSRPRANILIILYPQEFVTPADTSGYPRAFPAPAFPSRCPPAFSCRAWRCSASPRSPGPNGTGP